jgi:2-oxoisovalerate dehydrogenase E1 component
VRAHSGLKVVFPPPVGGKGLMQSALNGTDPVVFLRASASTQGEEFHEAASPGRAYEIAIGVRTLSAQAAT